MAEVKAVSRVEAIQNGDDVKPVSREEYFLKKSIGQGGSGGAGYTVETKAIAVVPEQSVTTAKGLNPFADGVLVLAGGITSLDDVPDTLTITFNGQEYVCSNYSSAGARFKSYGANTDVALGETIDWSVYPFSVSISPELGNCLATESAGTYTVKAETVSKTVTVTDDFALARGYNVNDGILAVVKGTPAR